MFDKIDSKTLINPFPIIIFKGVNIIKLKT